MFSFLVLVSYVCCSIGEVTFLISSKFSPVLMSCPVLFSNVLHPMFSCIFCLCSVLYVCFFNNKIRCMCNLLFTFSHHFIVRIIWASEIRCATGAPNCWGFPALRGVRASYLRHLQLGLHQKDYHINSIMIEIYFILIRTYFCHCP